MSRGRHHTGIIQLDEFLQGGLPSGICEVIGEDASGKSTLGFSVMREASLRGLPTALIHTEGYPDKGYIRRSGPTECLVSVPTNAEAAIESAHVSLLNGCMIVVIDSLSAAESVCDQAQIVGDRVPFAARKMAYHGLSILREEALKRNALVLVVNQLRTPIQALVPTPCSSFEGTINRLCAVRIRTVRETTRNEYGELAYLKVRFNIYRSLVSPPSDRAYGFLFNQKGFCRGFELMRALLSANILDQKGAYLVGKDGKSLGPGYLGAAEQINKNFEHYRRIYDDRSQSSSP